MTLQTKINELKKLYPSLTKGLNDEIVVLSDEEYEETITLWAENELAKEAELAETEAKAEAKAALLERLGITAEEAQLILGGSN
jgi:hypothetical protein